MKMLPLALLSLFLSFGCTRDTAMLSVAELETARVRLDVPEMTNQYVCTWIDLSPSLRDRIRCWLPTVLQDSTLSFVSYAPVLELETPKYSINMVLDGDCIVCNVELSSGKWRQYVRKMSAEDRMLATEIQKWIKRIRLARPLHKMRKEDRQNFAPFKTINIYGFGSLGTEAAAGAETVDDHACDDLGAFPGDGKRGSD